MPNYVYNTLTVEGSPESVKKLQEQVNKPFVAKHDNWNKNTNQMEIVTFEYKNPIFSFYNIYNYTNAGISEEEYLSQPQYKPNATFAEAMKFSTNDWYNFNVREWGTKWDVAVSHNDKYTDTELISDEPNGENHVLVYRFNTAWSPPIPVLEKLSAQYPDLLITLEYEEETGWGGEGEFLRGNYNEYASYNWLCRQCDYAEIGDPSVNYCDDCESLVCPTCGYFDFQPDEVCKNHEVANV